MIVIVIRSLFGVGGEVTKSIRVSIYQICTFRMSNT